MLDTDTAAITNTSESTGQPGRAGVLRIDCADCEHQRTSVCDDCLVTFLCDREDDGAVVVPISEIRAVRMLQGVGLAPEIRHRQRSGGSGVGVDPARGTPWGHGRPA